MSEQKTEADRLHDLMVEFHTANKYTIINELAEARSMLLAENADLRASVSERYAQGETTVTRLHHLREEIERGTGALLQGQAYLLADVCEALDMSDADTRLVLGNTAYAFVANPLAVVATNDDVAGELFTLENAKDRLGRRVMLVTDRDPYLPRGILGVVSALRRRGPDGFYSLGVAWGEEGNEALLTWVTRLEYDAWLEELPATVASRTSFEVAGV